MRLLVVNVGSSTIKLRVVEKGRAVEALDLELAATRDVEGSLRDALTSFGTIEAVAHRVVHGGPTFRRAVVIDDDVVERLAGFGVLAPLHQAPSLEAVAMIGQLLPEVPAVACFDTSFFAVLPAEATTYALPREWRQRYGIRRYGFHGLSHSYAARRARELAGGDRLRAVTCHLGAGASLAAVSGEVPLDTTMGFTPLEGLVMATRSGSVDPGLLLWLQTHGGMTAEEVRDGLEHRSGLRGLAGTADMRKVIAAAREGDDAAAHAIAVYVHRLRAGIASMAAALGGLDALVFTGGVGENQPEVRRRTCEGLGFLGVRLDITRNSALRGDAVISAETSVKVLVVVAREELEIARQAEEVLGGWLD
jgi:acetate kinase